MADGNLQTCTPPDSTVYYNSTYWNDLQPVIEHISEICTGDRGKWWVPGFQEAYCGRGPFEHGLFLNCGNGWVEREFCDRGIVTRATAFDYSADLLRAAESERGRRDIVYLQADANLIDFEPDSFDLVVNVGALHHVQYLDRLCRILCKALTEDGLLVGYDYVGPARNQYSRRHWQLLQRTNRSLPPSLRKEPLAYPHLRTMIATDPTEAIHSDLELPTLARYFRTVERHDLGGGLAYELLSHNQKLASAPPAELASQLGRLLALDRSLTESGKLPTLFSYYVLTPDKRSLSDPALDRHRKEETRREALAGRLLGAYTLPGFLQLLAYRLYDLLRPKSATGGLAAGLSRAVRRRLTRGRASIRP
jgi:SAM-dependent methyltransferase